jgi:hypothetical protein
MSDFTILNGARFSISNIFRSIRFDIDRLDLSWVEDEKPEFTRGLRIVDYSESNMVLLDGEDADNLIYSLAYFFGKEEGFEACRLAIEPYLLVGIETKEFLITAQTKNPEGKAEASEAFIH